MAKFEIEKIFQLGGEHLHDWTHWKLYNDKDRTNLIMESNRVPEDLKVWEPVIVDEGELYDGSYGVYLSVQISYNGVVKPWKDEEACCLNAMMKNGLPCPDKPRTSTFKVDIRSTGDFTFTYDGVAWIDDDSANIITSGATLSGDTIINGEAVVNFRIGSNSTVSEVTLIKGKNLSNLNSFLLSNYALTKFTALPGSMSSLTSMYSGFRNNSNLVTVTLADTPKLTNLNYVFRDCRSLVNLGPINTSKVTTTYDAFYSCYSLITIPPMDFSSVTNLSGCFMYCLRLEDFGTLDLASCTNMRFAFHSCSSMANLELLNTTNVTVLESTFYDCTFDTYPGFSFPAAYDVKKMLASNSYLSTFDGRLIGKPTICDNLFDGNQGMKCLSYLDTTNGGGVFMFRDCNVLDLSVTNITNIEAGYLYDRTLDVDKDPTITC